MKIKYGAERRIKTASKRLPICACRPYNLANSRSSGFELWSRMADSSTGG